MNNPPPFSGFGLYFLWFLLFIFFYSSVSAVFAFTVQRDAGIPAWLLSVRIAILIFMFLWCFLTLGRRRLAVWGFWITSVLMIPFTITYNYYFNLNIPEFIVTSGWVIQNTIITTVFILVMVWLYNRSIRNQLGSFY